MEKRILLTIELFVELPEGYDPFLIEDAIQNLLRNNPDVVSVFSQSEYKTTDKVK